jgi:citrate synthase
MTWSTAITKIEPNKITVRGHVLSDLIGVTRFGQMVYLLLIGKMPEDKVGQLIEAILVSSVDHGVTPPSCVAARTVASCGTPLTSALAAGILSIGNFHGGAVEDCMQTLQRGIAMQKDGLSPAQAAEAIAKEAKEAKKRLSGLGHRLHTDDPRTRRLIEFARELGLAGQGVEQAEALVAAIGKTSSKTLPLNVDGAIAALLVDLGFPPEAGNAFFIMSRVPGLVAHILEERRREKPMRTIVPAEAAYDGPGA